MKRSQGVRLAPADAGGMGAAAEAATDRERPLMAHVVAAATHRAAETPQRAMCLPAVAEPRARRPVGGAASSASGIAGCPSRRGRSRLFRDATTQTTWK